MQSHNAYHDPSYSSPAAYNNGAAATLAGSAEPYIHPTIPLGLPHVVQFVEASIHHLPMSVRFVGDRLSRYANAKGEVSMAASFLCRITGLGSRNTADHHLRLIESLGVLEKQPGQGGKDRKSNTYVFQGADRNWKPLPTERPGTDPWVALARSRRENEALRSEIEELQAELARLMNGATIAHPGVTDGDGVPHPEQSSHSYETAGPVRSSEESGSIAHSELSNGPETIPPQEASHSYETADPGGSPGESGAITHSELSNGPETAPPQEASHSYETSEAALLGNPDPLLTRIEQWARDGAHSGCLPQLRNRRSCQIIRGIRSHCSLGIEQWAGDGAHSGCLPQLRNRRSCQIIRGIRSHCSLGIEQWAGDGAHSGCLPQLRNLRSCQIIRGIRSHCSLRTEQWAGYRPRVPVPPRPGGGAGHGAPGLLRPPFQRGCAQRRPPFLPQLRERRRPAPPGKCAQGRSGTGFLRGSTRSGKTTPPPGTTDGIRPQGGGVLPGLRQPLHHVQRGGTVPGLHRPPPEGE